MWRSHARGWSVDAGYGLLVLADPQTNSQVNWGDLVEEGVADLLVEEGWVLPGKKSSDAVALTAKGLKEAAKIKLMIGED